MIDEVELPDRLRLRLRVPAMRADNGDPGTVTVEVQLGEPPQPINGCQILELVFGWGASSDSGVVTTADAGSATLRLVDPLRLFDPANTESSFAGIGTTIRLLLNGAVAFRGRVDDVQHDLDVATLSLVDGIAALAGVQFTETSVPAETTSSRITRILDLAAWPADRRDIGSGGRSLQAGTVSADAWSELLKVTRNELGALWLTPDGRVAWRSRTTAWLGGAPVMTFGCEPSDAFVGSMTTRADQSDLVNVLAAARRGGTQATRTDATSLGIYGRHSHVQNDLELATDDERDLWSDFYIIRQANPASGVAGFDMRPDSAALSKLLALQLGAIVRIYDEHHGPVIDRRARWLGAKWKIAPAYVEVDAVVGEDASIRQVARHLLIDTPAEWQAAAQYGNLVANGSFESDLTSWVSPAGTVTTPVDAAAVHGSKLLKIVSTGGDNPGVNAAAVIPVVAGQTVRLRAYAKHISGASPGRVFMHCRIASGAITRSVFLQWLTGEASYKEAYYTVETGVVDLWMQPCIAGGAIPAGCAFYIDDISVVYDLNASYREPGVAPTTLPAPLTGPYLTRDEKREELLEVLDDASRPTPSPAPTPEPKRARGRPRKPRPS